MSDPIETARRIIKKWRNGYDESSVGWGKAIVTGFEALDKQHEAARAVVDAARKSGSDFNLYDLRTAVRNYDALEAKDPSDG